MAAFSDARKAYRLLHRALASRAAEQRVRRTVAAQPPPPAERFCIAVYYADGPVNMYQMRQWYRPLAELGKTWPVVVLSRSATGAEVLLADAALPVAFVQTVRDLEQYLAEQDIRIVLYVNQNTRNFQMFRYGGRWHVFINHGESDKMYMMTNQYKAYDFALVAGQAARDRLARVLWDYDIERRTLVIGRPQADHYSGPLPCAEDERTVVLYAPTWEGDRPAAHYGSLRTHGEALVSAVLASDRHRLIYRPHPRSGAIDPEYGAADRRVVQAIEAANAADPTAAHVYDQTPELGWQLTAADVAVVDISAMVYDRLAVGKPLFVTRPADRRAQIDTVGYLSECEWLSVADAERILAEADRIRDDAMAAERLDRWVRHYFGDTTPGAATAAFHAAIDRLMDEWERWHSGTALERRTGDGDAAERADEDDTDPELG